MIACTVSEGLKRIAVLSALIVLSSVSTANERGFQRDETIAEHHDEIKIAIIVGVDNYDYVGDLNYAEADAKALTNFFKSQDYIVETVLGFDALGDRVLEKIRDQAKFLEPHDNEPNGSLVFTFSGHGFNNDKENFLATPDTDINNLEETALRMSAVKEALKALNVRKRILFIDACRNNPIATTRNAGGKNGTFIEGDTDGKGLAIMYSTEEGSLSWEDPSLGRGVFTHYLVEGLRGQASQEGGVVSFDGLHKYVARQVRRHVAQTFKEVQIPYKGGEWSGEFVLARHEGASYNPLSRPDTQQNNVLEPLVFDGVSTIPLVPHAEIDNPQVTFDFLQAAANLTMVRGLFCTEVNHKEGQILKKKANSVFLGKYEHRGKSDEYRGWQLYLDSMKNCSTAAALDLSKVLAKRSRCDIAIEYAQLAAENGNKSASRYVNQLKSRLDSCKG